MSEKRKSSKMERVRETLHHAWENIRKATHEQRRGSNFTFHRGILLILITSGALTGLLLGFILSITNWKPTSRDLHYLGYPGKLFIGALRSMNIPVVLASVISAAGSMEFKLCVKTIILGLGMFLSSVYTVAWLAISMALLIGPGKNVPDTVKSFLSGQTPLKPAVVADLFLDLFRSFFPRNIVEAALKNYQTRLEPPKNSTVQTPWEDYKIVPTYKDGTNFNGLIVYGIVMGLAAVKLGVYGKPLIAFTRCLSECVAFLSNCIMWAAPIGIASLLATEIASQPNIKTTFTTLQKYVLCVVVCAIIWETVMLALVKVITRRSITKFLKDLMPALVIAFGTSSSLSTSPIVLTCLDINGVNPRVSRFLIPLACAASLVGATIFTTSAVMAVLQYLEADFGISEFVQMSLLAPPAALSITGGQGTLAFVKLLLVQTYNGKKEELFEELTDVVLPVDWFLDRVGTVCNVITMASLVSIACHIRRKELEELPDYNAILKEGLVFKRLSLLKTSVTSGDSDKPVEEVSQLKEQLHIDEPDPEDLTPEQKKKKKRLRRLTAILTEPFLRQQQNNVATTETEQASAEKSTSKVKKTKKPKLKLTNLKKAIAKPLGVGKKKKE